MVGIRPGWLRSFIVLLSVFLGGSSGTSIIGVRVEGDNFRGYEKGVATIIAGEDAKIGVFGQDLTDTVTIRFTLSPAEQGAECESFQMGPAFTLQPVNTSQPIQDAARATIRLDEDLVSSGIYYVCVSWSNKNWTHSGTSQQVQLKAVKKHWIPLWVQIVLIIILQLLSGLFSGLNLGLLSLDPTELQIVASCGAPQEKKYAKHIIPLRRRGNFLLCSLVIGNVLVNSTLTIFLDDLTTGLMAVILSTVGIVLFGEIVPQALCNRFGLAIGSATRYVTVLVMAITCVISYPLSRLLDVLLGREIGTVYDRERLVELIRVTKDHNQLENEEVNIISGTLSLKRKTVSEIMIPIDEVFMITFEALLDFETLQEITRQGYTRIPVYEGNRENVVGLLNIKDMALLDPDDCTSVKTVVKYYGYELCFVFEDTTLDVMLEEFKKGRSHIAFIQKVLAREDRDPVYETIGVVTLEDIIEEMIQAEILDESDKDDRSKKVMRKDLQRIFQSRPTYNSLITPQLQHATYQFLSTSIEAFHNDYVSETIVRRLIRHPDVARMLRHKANDLDPSYLFQLGRPVDYFVLILEGRVEVKIGREGLVFESGPFTFFGISAFDMSPAEREVLVKSTPSGQTSPRVAFEVIPETGLFRPDFTVTAVGDVLFLRIKRAHYVAALRATAIERQSKPRLPSTLSDTGLSGPASPGATPTPDVDTFGQEMDRVTKDEPQSEMESLPVVAVVPPPPPPPSAQEGDLTANPTNGSAVFIKVAPSQEEQQHHLSRPRTPSSNSSDTLAPSDPTRLRRASRSPSRKNFSEREREPLLPPAGAPSSRE